MLTSPPLQRGLSVCGCKVKDNYWIGGILLKEICIFLIVWAHKKKTSVNLGLHRNFLFDEIMGTRDHGEEVIDRFEKSMTCPPDLTIQINSNTKSPGKNARTELILTN